MENSIRKIVVAIDFDDEAEDILQLAGELGNGLSAEVHLVHVYEPDPYPTYELMLYPVLVASETEAEHEAFLQEERRQLRRQADKLRRCSVKAFAYMKPVDKNVPNSILNFRSEIHADLLLIGTNRPNRLEEMIVGSVAKKVLKQSSVPVLLVPRKSKGS